MSLGPLKPNPSPFSMTKINVTNSIIFVTDSIATSHNGDMKDDVAVDLTVTWIVMMTWLLTWQWCGQWRGNRTWCGKWHQQHSPQVDGPNSEWATKLDLIFNPFIRIVITAQNTYQNCKTISHSIKSNTISRIYIEKHLKIYMLW